MNRGFRWKTVLSCAGFLAAVFTGYSAASLAFPAFGISHSKASEVIIPLAPNLPSTPDTVSNESTTGQEGPLTVAVTPSAIVQRNGSVILRSVAEVSHREGADMLYTVETFNSEGEVIDAVTSSEIRLPKQDSKRLSIQFEFDSTSKDLSAGDYCVRLNVAALNDNQEASVKFSTHCFSVMGSDLTPLETEEYLLRNGNLFHSGAELAWVEEEGAAQ